MPSHYSCVSSLYYSEEPNKPLKMREISHLTHEIPPPEVITEILHRLPAKSIGRFRCVSKGWLALLTDPQFIKTHTEKTLKQHHLIFESRIGYEFGYYYNSSFTLYSHPFHEIVVTTPAKFSLEMKFVQEITFSGSCDGLVLVGLYCGGDWPFKLLLVNPTTRENLQLPQDYYKEVRRMIDAAEHTEIMCGFGYDIVTDDYKVVTVTYFYYYTSEEEDDDMVEGVYVYVYSLKSKTWRRVIDFDSLYYYDIESSDGVFVNGFIHWIVSKVLSHDNLLAITVFSLADESFSEISFPKSCNHNDMHYCQLVVLGGKLGIFLKNKGELWLMNEYGVRESWTQISLHGINKIPLCKQEERYTKPEPLVMDDKSKILVANNDRMMLYEVEKETFSETVCVWNPNNLLVFGYYVESLVSLKQNITEQKSTNSNEGRQTTKRKNIGFSNVPTKHLRVNSYSGSTDIPKPSSCELLDPQLIQHRLKGVMPLHLNQEDLGISNGDFNSVYSFEAIRENLNLRATGHVVGTLSRDIKTKNVMILDLEWKVYGDYDSWKAKHQEEQLRVDRLENDMNHALSKQKFVTCCLEENDATIQSKLVESFERTAMEEFTLEIPPPEVITKILYRVPAKSVGRFRCVSKGWLSLLTDPQFIETHQNTINQKHLILKSCHDKLLHSHPFDHHEAVLTPTKFHIKLEEVDLADDVNFLGSCDGLVLVLFDWPFVDKELVVFNPTTWESFELPEYEYIDGRSFDDIEIDIMYGFGYDCVTDDYFHYPDGFSPDSNYVSVFSLRNKTWRRVIDSPFKFSSSFYVGAVVNGFVHWVAKKSFDGLLVIVAFSFADECFSEVPSPNLYIMSKDHCNLVNLGGKFVIYEGCEALVMNEYGVKESWTKIPLDRFDEIPLMELMIFYDNGKIRVASNDRMLIYDVGKGTFSTAVYVWNPKTFKAAATYVESLVSQITCIEACHGL